MHQTLIRKRDAAARIGRSISGLEKLRKTDPSFPAAVKFGSARQAPVYFDEGELNHWIEAKKARRQGVAA